jgi:4a-hydroxytetrahydrobiopterin dehydratase
MTSNRLTEHQVIEAVGRMEGWTLRDGRLNREIKFTDFSEAWAFMSRVALLAEQMNHHPDWSNVWNTVRIALWSHDVGGISDRDLAMAQRINELL